MTPPVLLKHSLCVKCKLEYNNGPPLFPDNSLVSVIFSEIPKVLVSDIKLIKLDLHFEHPD